MSAIQAYHALLASVAPLPPSDPYFASVSSLLHFDGSDTSTTFTDVTGKTWTPAGDAQIDTAQSLFGGAAGLFDGTGDSISTPDHADFTISADFTIDLAIRLATISGDHHILGKYGGAGTGPFAIYQTGSQIGFYSSSNGTTWDIHNNLSFGSGFAANTWYRLRAVRSGNNWYAFRDGSVISTGTSSSTPIDNAGAVTLGSNGTGSNPFSGWLDEWRFTKGVARSTAGYTPDAAAFLNS